MQNLDKIKKNVKRQLEFNQLMTKFYPANNENDMQKFMLSCLDKRIIAIMLETD